MVARSSTSNMASPFCGLRRAATTTLSNRCEATSMISTWPLCTGSKDPGYRTVVTWSGAAASAASGGDHLHHRTAVALLPEDRPRRVLVVRRPRRRRTRPPPRPLGHPVDQGSQQVGPRGAGVGRVEQHQVPASAGGGAGGGPRRRRPPTPGRPGRWWPGWPPPRAGGAVDLDEGAVRSAPREGLDAERPAAGEGVEDPGPGHRAQAPQGVEGRLPHPVGGRPGAGARRGDQPEPPGRAGDDPHQARARRGRTDGRTTSTGA